MSLRKTALLVLLALTFSMLPLMADEGVWTFERPPVEKIKQDYGFELTSDWLDHLRLSAIRLSDGGSASFVSADGLILTNHHVASGCIQRLSSEGQDYMAEGYGMTENTPELQCPGMIGEVLESATDVTEKVWNAGNGADDSQANAARRAVIAELEKTCELEAGVGCKVVSLYSGGEYRLYRYRKYEDLRLVFAPENQLGYFGGDPDNFNYPRFVLDFALLRAYGPDGKPIRPTHYLKPTLTDVNENDLVFIAGNPAGSSRLKTVAQYEFLRDLDEAAWQERLLRRRALLIEFSRRSPEAARQAFNQLMRIQNGVKVANSYLAGLRNEQTMVRKKKEEEQLRARIAEDPALAAQVGDAWQAIESAMNSYRTFFKEMTLLNVYRSRYYEIAYHLVQLADQKQLPEAERLSEYQDAALDELFNRIFSKSPMYDELEEAIIADALRQMVDELGEDHPAIKSILKGKKPEQVAAAAIANTKLADVAMRKELAEGGKKAVDKSKDSMILLAGAIVPQYMKLRLRYEKDITPAVESALLRIARARLKLDGSATYPDATYNLRLSYGKVTGYEQNGILHPFKTTLYGLYDRHFAFQGRDPFQLPARWLNPERKLNLSTPMNFVTTAECFPGNSGSPVVNTKGEVVGVVFDVNSAMLGNQYLYDETQARSIVTSFSAIAEVLKNVYGRTKLIRELANGS